MRKPARKIKKSRVKNICKFPSTKSDADGYMIIVESILEKDYCYHLQFDQTVTAYYPQPHTLDLVFNEEESHSYTPDFEVHYSDGRKKYIEVKPKEYLEDAFYKELLSFASKSVEKDRYGFETVDEVEIQAEPLISNFRKLFKYQTKPSLTPSIYRAWIESISWPKSFGDLVEDLDDSIGLAGLYTLIAHNLLSFDIHSELLSNSTMIEPNDV